MSSSDSASNEDTEASSSGSGSDSDSDSGSSSGSGSGSDSEAKEGKEGKDGNKGKEKAPPPSGGEATAVDPAMAEKWKREDEALAKISAAEDAAAKNSAIDGHIAWANAFADQMESWGSNPQVPKSVIIVKLQERGIKYGKFLRKHKVHPSTAMAKITKTVKMGDLLDILRAFSEELEDSKVLTSTN
jgi:hypothetical protein